MELKDRQNWESLFLNKIQENKSKRNKVMLDLINMNKTPLQEKILKKMLDAEYKNYVSKYNHEKLKKQSDELVLKALNSLKQEKIKNEKKSRKERTHELIMLGTLIELTGFEKDRGLLAGVLLDSLKKIENDNNVKNTLKAIGDQFILSKEQSKKNRNKD